MCDKYLFALRLRSQPLCEGCSLTPPSPTWKGDLGRSLPRWLAILVSFLFFLFQGCNCCCSPSRNWRLPLNGYNCSHWPQVVPLLQTFLGKWWFLLPGAQLAVIPGPYIAFHCLPGMAELQSSNRQVEVPESAEPLWSLRLWATISLRQKHRDILYRHCYLEDVTRSNSSVSHSCVVQGRPPRLLTFSRRLAQWDGIPILATCSSSTSGSRWCVSEHVPLSIQEFLLILISQILHTSFIHTMLPFFFFFLISLSQTGLCFFFLFFS